MAKQSTRCGCWIAPNYKNVKTPKGQEGSRRKEHTRPWQRFAHQPKDVKDKRPRKKNKKIQSIKLPSYEHCKLQAQATPLCELDWVTHLSTFCQWPNATLTSPSSPNTLSYIDFERYKLLRTTIVCQEH